MILSDSIYTFINLIIDMLATIQIIPGLSLSGAIVILLTALVIGKVVGYLFRE